MNFIEWLALKEFEMGSNGEPEFSNGQTKPTPQLTSLANNITANSQPNTINKINTAPESKKKQTLMNTVKKKIPELSPNDRKKVPASDLAIAFDKAAGTNVLDGE